MSEIYPQAEKLEGSKEKQTFSIEEVHLSEEQRENFREKLLNDAKKNKIRFRDDDVDYLLDIIAGMTEEEGIRILTDAQEFHARDPNFPDETRFTIKKLLSAEDNSDTVEERVESIKLEAALIHYHSPYPEVRGNTQAWDDPNTPVETFRAYFLAVIWIIIGTGVNQFFDPRMPGIGLPASLLQILLVPCGKALEYALPDWGFNFRGTRYTLNPGPWNYKEQTLVTIMFGISISGTYVGTQIYVQRLALYYNNKWAGAGYQILLSLSTQYLGFGLAGLVRHVLVYSPDRLWPSSFPTLALNRTLLEPSKRENINGWTLSRYQLFAIAATGSFFYFWLPNYLFQALSTFNWMTWIAPGNFNLAAITGSVSGLGLNPIPSFDWNIISQASPLVTPFFSNVNNYVGAVIGLFIIAGVYYTNQYNSAYLPINSNRIFTNQGEPYLVTKVVENGVLDEQKYQRYSPPYYSAANLVQYGVFFAMYPAIFVDMLLRQRRIIYDGTKHLFLSLTGKIDIRNIHDDAHSRMMKAYQEVPHWWYLVVLLISLIFSIVTVEVYPTEAPVWGIFLAIALSILFVIPIGVLLSTANVEFSLNVLAELIAGYAFPGKGVALMIIKAFGVNTNLQAINFTADQKLGHYAKIPPRATFRAQLIATFISVFVVLGVANWQINNYHDLCQPHQPQRFTCPGETTYYSASVVWGVIGPKRIFDHQYPLLKWTFLIGTIIPIFFFALEKLVPTSIVPTRWWYKFSPLLIMFGIMSYAPYNLAYLTGGLYFGFAFQKYIRHRYTAWFEKYNYVLSAALEAGIALSAIIIFFALQYHPKDLAWWGNDVVTAGLDGEGGALLEIPEQGYFGVPPGNYPW